MPTLDGVRALATIHDKAFVLAMHEGGMTVGTGDRIDLAGSVFRVDNVRTKPAQGVVEIDGTGALTAVLTALNGPPLRIMERARQPTDIAHADAEVRAVVRLPLKDNLRQDDVTYQVDSANPKRPFGIAGGKPGSSLRRNWCSQRTSQGSASQDSATLDERSADRKLASAHRGKCI